MFSSLVDLPLTAAKPSQAPEPLSVEQPNSSRPLLAAIDGSQEMMRDSIGTGGEIDVTVRLESSDDCRRGPRSRRKPQDIRFFGLEKVQGRRVRLVLYLSGEESRIAGRRCGRGNICDCRDWVFFVFVDAAGEQLPRGGRTIFDSVDG